MTDTSTDQVQKLNAAREAAQAVAEPSQGSERTETSIGESLSALMDGEASDIEVRRLLKLTESDPEVQARWRRYQLVRATLKGELDVDPHVDFSAQISTAIAREESLQVPGRMRRGWNGAGKVAIAASVAFAFIVGVQQLGPVGQNAGADVASGAPEQARERVEVNGGVPSGFELPPFAARTVSTDSQSSRSAPQLINNYSQAVSNTQLRNDRALQDHFDQLLLKHAERSSTNGSMGLLPFARISRMDAAQE